MYVKVAQDILFVIPLDIDHAFKEILMHLFLIIFLMLRLLYFQVYFFLNREERKKLFLFGANKKNNSTI